VGRVAERRPERMANQKLRALTNTRDSKSGGRKRAEIQLSDTQAVKRPISTSKINTSRSEKIGGERTFLAKKEKGDEKDTIVTFSVIM